jgi:SAM-dependent methyltransferase
MRDNPKQSESSDVIREFFKRWPLFYFYLSRIFGPIWFTGLEPQEFLVRYGREGMKVNLGSGPRKLGKDIVNLDMFPYEGVDIVGDLTKLPLQTESVRMIICDNVLEHVIEPELAVAEIERILSRGGVAYISTPYLYPFHSSPSDYTRWTHQGLVKLCKNFKMVELGVRGGTMSGITITLCNLGARALSFGSEKMYWMWVNLFLIVFFPLKFLDIEFNLLPFGLYSASVFYCVVEKT